MTKPIDIVIGNNFTLRTHMSVLDKDIEGYVSLDMSSARDVRVYLVWDRDMTERRPLGGVSVNGGVVSADVVGSKMRLGTYGVEVDFVKSDGKAARAFRRGLLRFVNCNDEVGEGEDIPDCPKVADVDIYINTDIDTIDIGMDAIPSSLVEQVEGNSRAIEMLSGATDEDLTNLEIIELLGLNK